MTVEPVARLAADPPVDPVVLLREAADEATNERQIALWGVMLDHFPHQNGSFIEECRKMLDQAELAAIFGNHIDAVLDEVVRLRAQVEHMRALHEHVQFRNQYCGHCRQLWPCDTIRALGGSDD